MTAFNIGRSFTSAMIVDDDPILREIGCAALQTTLLIAIFAPSPGYPGRPPSRSLPARSGAIVACSTNYRHVGRAVPLQYFCERCGDLLLAARFLLSTMVWCTIRPLLGVIRSRHRDCTVSKPALPLMSGISASRRFRLRTRYPICRHSGNQDRRRFLAADHVR